MLVFSENCAYVLNELIHCHFGVFWTPLNPQCSFGHFWVNLGMPGPTWPHQISKSSSSFSFLNFPKSRWSFNSFDTLLRDRLQISLREFKRINLNNPLGASVQWWWWWWWGGGGDCWEIGGAFFQGGDAVFT